MTFMFSKGWHEVDDSKPRFQGRLSVIDDLFSRVWMSHERHPTNSDSKRPRSGNYDNVNGTILGVCF